MTQIQYSIEEITRRTQRSFGVPKIKITGNDDIDISNLISQMNKAAADAWIIRLSIDLGLIRYKSVGNRYLQFLEDLCWMDKRMEVISKHSGLFNSKKVDKRNTVNGNKNIWTWIITYSNLLENDSSFSDCCTECTMDLVVDRLTDLAFLGKEYMLSTRHFAPIGLIKVCESLIVIVKTNKKKGNENNIKRLERVLNKLKEIV